MVTLCSLTKKLFMVGASEIIANITSVNVFEMTRFMVKKKRWNEETIS